MEKIEHSLIGSPIMMVKNMTNIFGNTAQGSIGK